MDLYALIFWRNTMAKLNNTTMLLSSTSEQTLTHNKEAPVEAPSDEPGSERPTLESVRLHATKAAAIWNSNEDDLRATTTLLEWRDNCRDEIRDEILTEIEGSITQDPLLSAWAETFDGATGGELAALRSRASDGRDDVDCSVDTACDLLRLAIGEGIRFEPQGNRANAAIRAAMRYLDDIGKVMGFIDGQIPADGGAA